MSSQDPRECEQTKQTMEQEFGLPASFYSSIQPARGTSTWTFPEYARFSLLAQFIHLVVAHFSNKDSHKGLSNRTVLC